MNTLDSQEEITRRRWVGLAAASTSAAWVGCGRDASQNAAKDDQNSYGEVETLLAPLCRRLEPTKPGEWLADHPEAGQSFDEYLKSDPVRASREWTTIYIATLGDATQAQKRIFELTRDYMERFFGLPVRFAERWPADKIPDRARRKHPEWGNEQVLTGFVLNELLLPARPKDALAYLALTTSDLWPGEKWNYVFGQASLGNRTGVWSIHRLGDPAKSKEDFQLCLRRAVGTASHETAHMLSMPHCIIDQCNLNGSNHLPEADSKPLHLCGVCERKMSWNLRQGPAARFARLEQFCKEHGLDQDADWFRLAQRAMSSAAPVDG